MGGLDREGRCPLSTRPSSVWGRRRQRATPGWPWGPSGRRPSSKEGGKGRAGRKGPRHACVPGRANKRRADGGAQREAGCLGPGARPAKNGTERAKRSPFCAPGTANSNSEDVEGSPVTAPRLTREGLAHMTLLAASPGCWREGALSAGAGSQVCALAAGLPPFLLFVNASARGAQVPMQACGQHRMSQQPARSTDEDKTSERLDFCPRLHPTGDLGSPLSLMVTLTPTQERPHVGRCQSTRTPVSTLGGGGWTHRSSSQATWQKERPSVPGPARRGRHRTRGLGD